MAILRLVVNPQGFWGLGILEKPVVLVAAVTLTAFVVVEHGGNQECGMGTSVSIAARLFVPFGTSVTTLVILSVATSYLMERAQLRDLFLVVTTV
jgi:hypothetical protein